MRRVLFCTAAAVVLLAVPAHAATIRVPADFPTIQAAIDAAQNGDTIQVSPGVYYENLVWAGKALTLLGSGADVTFVDAGGSGRCLEITKVPATARVEGFTFQHGRVPAAPTWTQTGGGLMLTDSAPTLANNVVQDNVAVMGGGISLTRSPVVLSGNRIAGNRATTAAAGVDLSYSAALFLGNTIDSNTTDGSAGGVRVYGTPATFINDTITRNIAGDAYGGAGILFWRTAGRMVNATVAGNRGGGVRQSGTVRGTITIVNAIVAANEGPYGWTGYDLVCEGGAAAVEVTHSIVGEGAFGSQILAPTASNILAVDPEFVDLEAGDVHLRPDSPGIDLGASDVPDLPPTDKDGRPRVIGASADAGAYESDATADTTPPVITADVEGPLGNNGWYVGDVTVKWTVTEDESEVSFTSGCAATTVDKDTAGLAFTCTATSAGGTASASVTIRRDAMPPTFTACAATPSILWPPDGRMVPVAVNVVATDTNDLFIVLQSVSSNEASARSLARGLSADMLGFDLGTDDREGTLRAARNGTESGRLYTLTYQAFDLAGNASPTCAATVLVPHSQKKEK